MSEDDFVRVNFRVEKHLRDAAKRQSERGEISEEGRKMLQRIAYGKEIEQEERLQKELEEKRSKRDSLKGQRREIDSKIDTLDTEIARLEERVENRNERKDKYEGMIEMLETSLEEGNRVFPEHGQVKTAASVKGVTAGEVIQTLKKRNPEIPDEQFTELSREELP